MKYSLTLLLSLTAYSAFAQDGKTYLPDENHLPGYRSPALQRQAQEERPMPKLHRKFDNFEGSKVGPNPEAIDQPSHPHRRELKHD